ncbi:Pvc16 family protein [Bradyrhizobium sp.]|jgi:hypothetical protein|uniref:Pvc16 family protein n=1 Tax=Bradyrhizobium sp. TaxID=376 RepID=UPI002DF7992B|nr:Pvc16 family protein [Bradyrhizobium sp.]
MALFNNLHDVGTALSDILRDRINPMLEVLPGPPLQNPTGTAEAIRVTLLWITPQPTHRNDPWEPRPNGQLTPPPLSLSGFYLTTAYGTTPANDPQQAYNLLGEVLRVFDAEPRIRLPDPAAAVGNGAIGITLVPTAADLMEKVYTPLQMPHRPWALFEVGPIQLVSRLQPGPEPALVHPGGIRLGQLTVGAPPEIESILPSPAGVGGRIRIDARYTGAAQAVRIGSEEIAAAAFVLAEPSGPIVLTLPPAVDAGEYDVSLRVAGTWSRPATLTIRDATVSSADAPAQLVHSVAADLVIDGRALAATTAVFAWPNAGVTSPADVATLAPGAVAATQVTVSAAALTALAGRDMRLALRVSTHRFTPFIRLRFTP